MDKLMGRDRHTMGRVEGCRTVARVEEVVRMGGVLNGLQSANGLCSHGPTIWMVIY